MLDLSPGGSDPDFSPRRSFSEVTRHEVIGGLDGASPDDMMLGFHNL